VGLKEVQKQGAGKSNSKNNSPIPEFINFPTYIFKDRKVAVLEIVVEYLKDKHKLTYHEIAKILNRDDRTIWTAYHRVQLKRKAKK
jgi:hypothetical protein